MARDRTLSILLATGGTLTILIGLVSGVLTSDAAVLDWLHRQHWYSPRTILVVFGAIALATIAVAAWQGLLGASADGAASKKPFDIGFRSLLLNKVQRERIDPRLHQGLREALRIDYGLAERPGAVYLRLRAYALSESLPPTTLDRHHGVFDVFTGAAGGQLLILGAPGTGKTNALLELASGLVAYAQHELTAPIPIIFSLPRWTLGRKSRTLVDWMREDLTTEYGLSRSTAETLIFGNHLLPLLDGLDEVAEHRRTECIEALNNFQQSRDSGPLAVCCRTAEYAKLPKLNLRMAVEIDKLSLAEVQREVAQPPLAAVRRALEADPQLWAIIDTPLWLHVLYGAAQVASAIEHQSQDPRQRLYARYIDYALGRELEGSPRRRTGREPLLRWLAWLASEMKRRDQSQFSFEDWI